MVYNSHYQASMFWLNWLDCGLTCCRPRMSVMDMSFVRMRTLCSARYANWPSRKSLTERSLTRHLMTCAASFSALRYAVVSVLLREDEREKYWNKYYRMVLWRLEQTFIIWVWKDAHSCLAAAHDRRQCRPCFPKRPPLHRARKAVCLAFQLELDGIKCQYSQ